jgi:hypothetical protein
MLLNAILSLITCAYRLYSQNFFMRTTKIASSPLKKLCWSTAKIKTGSSQLEHTAKLVEALWWVGCREVWKNG